ncbi:hypothetical protein M6I34_05115 [Burkholderiaceae bacterium FT117]|uniref:hypothetical protein n=1 Tax=Zeimonas sediminis TaxID=2944268 RepID=UPI00234316E9|nr:hypothetical protein [Zeimonas sediminis]MCM5569879.1 hypothetical protein [Zeimonas sediminis]
MNESSGTVLQSGPPRQAPVRRSLRDLMQRAASALATSAAVLAIAACGGGDDEPAARCPPGFTAAGLPTAGYNLAICLLDPGVAVAFDILDYPASVSPGPDDGYTLDLATPGFAMPSPVSLSGLVPGRVDTLGPWGVYVLDTEIVTADAVHEYFVYSFARAPQDPSTPNPAAAALPVEHVDYGMWETGTALFATPEVIGLYGGGWYRALDPKPAPAGDASYAGLVYMTYSSADTGTWANQLLAGVGFGGGTLSGSIDGLAYGGPVPVPLPPLVFASAVVNADGTVSGSVASLPGSLPVAQGRFEGRFSGPDGNEFVARIAVYLPDAPQKIRLAGVLALKKAAPAE